MSRRSRRRSVNTEAERDDFSVPNRSVARPLSDDLRRREGHLDDERFYHPEGDLRPAITLDDVVADIVRRSDRRLRSPGYRQPHTPVVSMPVDRYAFDVPKRVSVCEKRERRREVLFAKRRLRGGAGRRSKWSDVRC